MSIVIRILAALIIAATLLAAGEDEAGSIPLPRVQLFPPVALAPSDGLPAGASGARRGLSSAGGGEPWLAYAVWDELGDSIRDAALRGRSRRIGSAADLVGGAAAAPHPALAPALAGAGSAAATRVVVTGASDPTTGASPRLDLYPSGGIFTPEVDGVRGYLELHLVGEVGIGFGFAIDF